MFKNKSFFSNFFKPQVFFFFGLIITFFHIYRTISIFLGGSIAGLWDINAYQNAINFYNEGGNPYLEIFNGLRFVYSPFVLVVFGWFGNYLTLVLFCLYVISFINFLRKKICRVLIKNYFITAFLFYNFFFWNAITTGNLSTFIHLFLITIGSNYKYIKQEYLFIATLLASIIKPYFATYIFFIFLKNIDLKKKINYLLIFFTSFIILFFSQKIIYPELFSDFIFSLKSQTIGNNIGAGIDIGIAPYSIFANIFKNKILGLSFHLIILLIAFYYIYKNILRIRNSIDKSLYDNLIFFSLLTFIVFLNPRLKSIDFWIIISTSTYFIFSLKEFISIPKKNLILIFTFATSTIIWMFNFFVKFGIIKHINYYLIDMVCLYFPFFIGMIILPNFVKSKYSRQLISKF